MAPGIPRRCTVVKACELRRIVWRSDTEETIKPRDSREKPTVSDMILAKVSRDLNDSTLEYDFNSVMQNRVISRITKSVLTQRRGSTGGREEATCAHQQDAPQQCVWVTRPGYGAYVLVPLSHSPRKSIR